MLKQIITFLKSLLSGSKHEKILMAQCFGNKRTFDNLINYELRKNPSITRKQAIINATEAIRKDNR